MNCNPACLLLGDKLNSNSGFSASIQITYIYIYICVHVCEICVILIESLDVSRSNPFPPVLSTRALVKCWICSFWRPIWGALNGVIDISLYLSISHSLSLSLCIYIYTCLSIDLSLSLARYLSIYLILYYIMLSYSNSILIQFYSILF
jgi:hypothetical protein